MAQTSSSSASSLPGSGSDRISSGNASTMWQGASVARAASKEFISGLTSPAVNGS